MLEGATQSLGFPSLHSLLLCSSRINAHEVCRVDETAAPTGSGAAATPGGPPENDRGLTGARMESPDQMIDFLFCPQLTSSSEYQHSITMTTGEQLYFGCSTIRQQEVTSESAASASAILAHLYPEPDPRTFDPTRFWFG